MQLNEQEVEIDGKKVTVQIPNYETKEDFERAEKTSAYFNPSTSQHLRMDDLRNGLTKMSHVFLRHCPPSRERALALTALEEAGFWIMKSIVHNEESSEENG